MVMRGVNHEISVVDDVAFAMRLTKNDMSGGYGLTTHNDGGKGLLTAGGEIVRGGRLKVQFEAQSTVPTRVDGEPQIMTLLNACREFGGQERAINSRWHDTDSSVNSGTQQRSERNN